MCHSTDSRPPAPPVVGAVAAHGELHLHSADGTKLRGYRADPVEPGAASVVLLPDVRGLHPYYEDLTVRFAEAGFPTVAIDYFGRTADSDIRDDDFEFMPHVQQVTPAHVRADVAAAIAHLPGPVFTVGFCFGGSHSWRLAASDLGLSGVIGFYGRPSMVEDVITEVTKPMLLLIAGADVVTTQTDFDAFTGHLDAAGVTYRNCVYDGAPHSFFDRSYTQWQDACTDAWQQILDFTTAYAE